MTDGAPREQAASPRRRQEARQRGHVPRSREFVFAVVYAASGALLLGNGPLLANALRERLRMDILSAAQPMQDPLSHTQQYIAQLGWWLLPWLLVIGLASVLAHWVQHGPLWLPNLVQWDISRVNPVDGLRRLMSSAALAQMVLAVLKCVVVAGLATWMLRQYWPQLLTLSTVDPQHLPRVMLSLLLRCAAGLGLGILVWGGVDLAWHFYTYERQLQMTPDEVREDIKAVHNDVSAARRRR